MTRCLCWDMRGLIFGTQTGCLQRVPVSRMIIRPISPLYKKGLTRAIFCVMSLAITFGPHNVIRYFSFLFKSRRTLSSHVMNAPCHTTPCHTTPCHVILLSHNVRASLSLCSSFLVLLFLTICPCPSAPVLLESFATCPYLLVHKSMSLWTVRSPFS